MSLETPEKIRNLQRKLYCKAKAEPAFRFYILYDKICREDVLWHAYALARANAGAPGVDGTTFEQIDASGVEAWLAGLREDLVSKTYRADPVRRATIPKPGGGERPLGIPMIRDRVVQTAVKIVLEPIFEADFRARRPTVPLCESVRGPRRTASTTRASWTAAVSLAMKSVGKPDALIGHVRFDERGRETGRRPTGQATAPFLDSTRRQGGSRCSVSSAPRAFSRNRSAAAPRAVRRSKAERKLDALRRSGTSRRGRAKNTCARSWSPRRRKTRSRFPRCPFCKWRRK